MSEGDASFSHFVSTFVILIINITSDMWACDALSRCSYNFIMIVEYHFKGQLRLSVVNMLTKAIKNLICQ